MRSMMAIADAQIRYPHRSDASFCRGAAEPRSDPRFREQYGVTVLDY